MKQAAHRYFLNAKIFRKSARSRRAAPPTRSFRWMNPTARRGVATHSSGNHGAAVARAAKLRGIPAHIVMPSNSAKVKVRAVESYGAQIVFCEPTERHVRSRAQR